MPLAIIRGLRDESPYPRIQPPSGAPRDALTSANTCRPGYRVPRQVRIQVPYPPRIRPPRGRGSQAGAPPAPRCRDVRRQSGGPPRMWARQCTGARTVAARRRRISLALSGISSSSPGSIVGTPPPGGAAQPDRTDPRSTQPAHRTRPPNARDQPHGDHHHYEALSLPQHAEVPLQY